MSASSYCSACVQDRADCNENGVRVLDQIENSIELWSPDLIKGCTLEREATTVLDLQFPDIWTQKG